MATNGQVATGDNLEVETFKGSGVFVRIGEVTNLPPPSISADQQEYTHMESGGWKEFGPGLNDAGDMQFDLNRIPGDATDTFIFAWFNAREVRATRLTTGGGKRMSYGTFPTSFSGTGQVGEKRTASITLKVTGQPVLSSVS